MQKSPQKDPEPLVLSFPYPITRKVDHDNVHK